MSYTTLLLLILTGFVNAQDDNIPATCSASAQFSWTFNSVGASPCAVATDLANACQSGTIIPRLDINQSYAAPQPDTQTPCECSSVYYNMLSACAYCQQGTWLSWTLYSINCTQIAPAKFPLPLPPNTKVPSWAYSYSQDPDGFFPNISIIIHGNGDPDSSAVGGPTGTSSMSTPLPTDSTSHNSSMTTTSSTPLASNTSLTADTQGSHSNIGPIIGGVIAGVVALCLTSLIICRIKRKRAQRTTTTGIENHDKPRLDLDMEVSSHTMSPPFVPGKLYNPDDPSTFPQNAIDPYAEKLDSENLKYNHSPSKSYGGIPEPH
ncbi:hypothetical protein CVT24_006587 [Panaeolus cyanescens]|uniref:Mid2 domain-containing protein n=1 Tax=Panaeolus cyanescens TaxID=181874 RepID=A0A409WNW5_9AGAR|nr:hypothetical protein CVT24_006587 [Panaeolus cyanescens]